MIRRIYILVIITFCMMLFACKPVIITSADEMLQGSWKAVTACGDTAELSFSPELSEARLVITTTDNEQAEISGKMAVDSDYLYISSEKYYTTFSFAYKVKADSLILDYCGESLQFSIQK